MTTLQFKRKLSGSNFDEVLVAGEPLWDMSGNSPKLYIGNGTSKPSELTYVGQNAEYASNAETANKLGGSTRGSTIKPIYLSNGAPALCSQYAGGTKVTLNGTNKGASDVSLYAPTTAGTNGQILVSSGSGAPSWSSTISASAISGTVAFNQLPVLYWANVEIGSSASTTTEPTFAKVNGLSLSHGGNGTAIEYQGTGIRLERMRLMPNAKVEFEGLNEGLSISGGSNTSNFSKLSFSGTYVLGEACEKAVIDNTSAQAIASSGTSLVTERTVYNGLPSINGAHNYSANNAIYAPTTVGANGQILVSSGSGAPSWSSTINASAIKGGEDGQMLFAKGVSDAPQWEYGRQKAFEEFVTHDPSDPVKEVTTDATLREGIYLCEVQLYGVLSVLTSVVEVSNTNTLLLSQFVGTIGASLVTFVRSSATMNIDSAYNIASSSEIQYVALYRLKTL